MEKIIDKKAQANKCPSFQVKIYPRSQQTANLSIMILFEMEKIQKKKFELGRKKNY